MTSSDVTVTSQNRQKHIFGHNFGSNCRSDFKLSLYNNITQEPSDVTLTLTLINVIRVPDPIQNRRLNLTLEMPFKTVF